MNSEPNNATLVEEAKIITEEFKRMGSFLLTRNFGKIFAPLTALATAAYPVISSSNTNMDVLFVGGATVASLASLFWGKIIDSDNKKHRDDLQQLANSVGSFDSVQDTHLLENYISEARQTRILVTKGLRSSILVGFITGIIFPALSGEIRTKAIETPSTSSESAVKTTEMRVAIYEENNSNPFDVITLPTGEVFTKGSALQPTRSNRVTFCQTTPTKKTL